jgi:hypothetical protein
MIKRLMMSQERAARREELERRAGTGPEAWGEESRQDLLMSLPPGACPGGGAVRADDADYGLRVGLGREARIEESRQDLLSPGAVRADGADEGLRVGLGPEARTEESRQDLLNPGAARADGAEEGLRVGPGREARIEESRQDLLDPDAARVDGADGGSQDRAGRRLLDSAETNQMAEQAERARDWTILIAIKAAQKTGQDWRPEVARLRKLNADNDLRARFMFRADGSEAAIGSLPPGIRPGRSNAAPGVA